MRRAYRAFVSSLLLVLLGLQTAASFGLTHPSYLWPFLNYPMYAQPHRLGDSVAVYSIVGITSDGREIPIPKEELNLNFWQYNKGPVECIQRGDVAGALGYLIEWKSRHRARLTALRLENRPVALGSQGTLPVSADPVVLRLDGRPS